MSQRICVKVAIFTFSVVLLLAYGSIPTANAGLTPEQARELGEIQKAIKAKGAKWEAGETSVSKLSREERKRLCGVLFAEEPGMVPASGTLKTAPTVGTDYPSFDWREENSEVVSPIKDQGNCGSCWAFAAVGAMESTLMINGNYSGEDLSEQFVVSCNRNNFGCNGGYMDRVYNFLTETGTTDEDCFLYTSGLTGISPRCNERCSDWNDRVEKITGWQWVANSEESIKNAVYLDGPVSCTMYVYEDFFEYSAGVYEHSWGGYVGGHAVIIIGWGTEGDVGYWTCKNSWGTGWGEQGYFRIKWGACGIGGNAAKYSYTLNECPDSDGDGYTDESCGGQDCNDNDPNVKPGATEVCGDGVDNNCDGLKGNIYYEDFDNDGFGNPNVTIDNSCNVPDGYVSDNTDCDDTDNTIYPGAYEDCDGVDNNCDGTVDEGCSTCAAKGDTCTDNSDCCSGKCLGAPGKKKCK